ncbi:hypothetical protein CW304_32180 [Bacillus sp. UFRGS-B20]|nr:hypothetical protein CW304_32180 [Bacillus sp. UFRGS-B20]
MAFSPCRTCPRAIRPGLLPPRSKTRRRTTGAAVGISYLLQAFASHRRKRVRFRCDQRDKRAVLLYISPGSRGRRCIWYKHRVTYGKSEFGRATACADRHACIYITSKSSTPA